MNYLKVLMIWKSSYGSLRYDSAQVRLEFFFCGTGYHVGCSIVSKWLLCSTYKKLNDPTFVLDWHKVMNPIWDKQAGRWNANLLSVSNSVLSLSFCFDFNLGRNKCKCQVPRYVGHDKILVGWKFVQHLFLLVCCYYICFAFLSDHLFGFPMYFFLMSFFENWKKH